MDSSSLTSLIVSMGVGYLALKLVWKTLSKRRFYLFSLYCWLVGMVLLGLNLAGF
ncbi:hypothetical protein KAI12_02365 [Candidatus Bathyarchaeota archaeon]|nr:hypothetical protein [Candidatus Bathyarchaeota archaeon]